MPLWGLAVTHEAIKAAFAKRNPQDAVALESGDGLSLLYARIEFRKYSEAFSDAEAIFAADRDRLAAELEEANKDEQAAYELTSRLTAEVEAAANLLELAHVYMKDDGSPAFKTIEGRVKEFINRVDRSAAIDATQEVKP